MRLRGSASYLVALLFPVALLAFAESARAQSCGGSAGPSLAGAASSQGTWLKKGQASAQLFEEYEVKDRSYKGAHEVPNDFSETLVVSRTALDLRYGLSDDWTAELTPTYPWFKYRLKPPGGQRSERKFRGPGDTFVWLGRRFDLGDAPATHTMSDLSFPPATHEMSDAATCPAGDEMSKAPVFSLWAGASLPTGTAEKPNPAFVTSDVSVANLQTGTGTFDPLARARIEWPGVRWSPFIEADVRFPLYENRYGYRTADAEAVAAGVTAPLVSRLSATLALIFQHTGRDTYRGEDVGVGGARWLYVGPGLSWQATDAIEVDAGCRVPVYRRTETKLSDSNVVWQFGLTWRF